MSGRLFPTEMDDGAPTISAEAYLEHHSIPFYMRDVTRLLLESRTEKPVNFISQYFDSVMSGENTYLREFDYVNSTSRNRSNFLYNLQNTYTSIPEDDLMTYRDCLELVRMLCPDFRENVVSEAFATASYKDGAGEEAKLKSFVDAISFHFLFTGFIRHAHRTFSHCDKSGTDRVNRSVFFLCLKQMILQNTKDIVFPSLGDIEDALFGKDRRFADNEDPISFQDFCVGFLVDSSLLLKQGLQTGTVAAHTSMFA